MPRISHVLRWSIAAVSSTVLTLTLAGPPAQAAPAVPKAAQAVSAPVRLSAAAAALSPDPQVALAKYWTKERIARAKPADQQVDPAAVQQAAQTALLGKIEVGPRKPAPAAADGKVRALAGATGTSWPARHDWVSLTNGKVLYTDANGAEWHCSGVVVTTEARNTVFTAGHCVHGGKGGGWHNQNWTFIPDYYYGDRPLGTWQARELWSLNGWINDSNRGYDVGAAVMFTNGGQRLADRTGSQGIRINGPGTPSVWHFGFPLNTPFDGEDLITCDGSTSRRSLFNSDLKMSCTMQGGASGGAFLADFNQDWGYTVSVNSYHLGNDLTKIYGPYFGDGVHNLYEAVRNLS